MGFFAFLPALFKALPAVASVVGGVLGNKSASKSLSRAEQQQAEANRLNEERFQEILAGFRRREFDAQTAFKTLEQSGVAELRRQGGLARSQSQQSLVSRGLGGTSRLESEREGIGSRLANQIEQLRAQQSLNKINTLGEFQRQRLAFQERKVVQGPSAQQLGILQQQAGQGTSSILSGAQDLGLAFGNLLGRNSGSTVQPTSFRPNPAGDFFRNRTGF